MNSLVHTPDPSMRPARTEKEHGYPLEMLNYKTFECRGLIYKFAFSTSFSLADDNHPFLLEALDFFVKREAREPHVNHPESNAPVEANSGNKCFQCQQCFALFTRSDHLNRHMRRHTGERPFTCQCCPFAFSSKDSLKRHMRTHTGERPFQCPYCRLSFAVSYNLVCHLRTHGDRKPWKCRVCSMGFSRKLQMSAHMRLYHGS